MSRLVVVEDNDLDVERIERALTTFDNPPELIHVTDGRAALDLLLGPMQQEGHTRIGLEGPFVLLVDLNMPLMNGFEFVEELRRDDRFAATPIFICTTSNHPSDIERIKSHGVQGYVVKPISNGQLQSIVAILDSMTPSVAR